jgi:hypothetical protein
MVFDSSCLVPACPGWEIRDTPRFSNNRLYLLDTATLSNNQKVALNLSMVNMRSMLLLKMKKLKVPVPAVD